MPSNAQSEPHGNRNRAKSDDKPHHLQCDVSDAAMVNGTAQRQQRNVEQRMQDDWNKPCTQEKPRADPLLAPMRAECAAEAGTRNVGSGNGTERAMEWH